MLDWLNKNYTWALSGLGVTILALMFKIMFKFIKSLFTSNSATSPSTNVINQNITIGTNESPHPKTVDKHSLQTKRGKSSVTILFIDDKKVSFIASIKRAGYTAIKYLKDCTKIDCNQVIEAEIIFVDINGVGTSLFPTDQGLGLAMELKSKFPSKCIVLYSAEPQYLKNEFRALDGILPKNSEPYEFIKIIEDYINK